MILQMVRARRRQILVDINTQQDYLLAQGKACIRNHRRVLLHIRRMMAWARKHDILIISTCQINYGEDGYGESHTMLHNGQAKVSYTELSNHISFAADNYTDLPRDMMQRYRQIILHKRTIDPFDEPRIDRLLSEIKAAEFILIGTCTEGAVQSTALGLLQRGKNVTVVVDAVGSRDHNEAKMALRKMEAKGAHMIETRRLAGDTHLRQVNACGCDSCLRALTKATVTADPED